MPDNKDELREKLAAIEHERWSDWQKYMQSLATPDFNQEAETLFTYTTTQFARWNKQIETPYSELSDREKASDMEQVERYWPLIEAYNRNQLKSLKAKLPEKFNEITADDMPLSKSKREGFNGAIDQVNKIVDEMIGEK